MQIRKTKSLTVIKLTRAEMRQVEAAQEIVDTVRMLGGTVEDIEAGLDNDGVIRFGDLAGATEESPVDEDAPDLEAVEAPPAKAKKAKA
jgi:hypothetical protein